MPAAPTPRPHSSHLFVRHALPLQHRYATLPNIMKAKKKTITAISPQELDVDISPRLITLQVRAKT